MKRLKQKLRCRRGITLVEMVAAAVVLSLLGLMLQTGLFMAQDSYAKMTAEAESQLLLSTLSNLLANELRYARDVATNADGTLQRYTSVSYGGNTTLSLDEDGQLRANTNRQMLSSGAYGNGAYRIDICRITYDTESATFQITLKVTGNFSIANETSFSVRCLNAANAKGGST